MIDRNLLKYPEQLAARLTQMENDINAVKRRGGKVIANGGGGGGGDITVVQTTGTSTTKVMSQNAVTVALGDKVDKVSGKGLSSNDYTTADKNKLTGIEAGAQVNDIEVIKKNGTALPISSKTVDIAVPTKTSDLTNDAGFITSSYHDSTKQNLILDALLTAGTQSTNKTVNTYSINTPSLIPSSSTSGQKTTAFDMATTSTAGMMSGTDKTNLDNTVSYIPSQASSTNQLADKDFVNSSINSVTAYYITKNASGDQFNTKAELDNATVFYSGGEVRVPTRNDYCVVLEDESKRDPDSGQDPTTRYIYQNGQWEYQYTINATAFTAAQLAALNSGITSVKVTKLNGIENGAQINVLEGVQLNGVDQTITNKKVNIPVANDSNIGVSKLYSYTGHSNDGSMDQNTVTTTFIQSEDPVSIPTIAAATIKTLHKDGNEIYPTTVADAVVDEDNHTVQQRIDTGVYFLDGGTASVLQPWIVNDMIINEAITSAKVKWSDFTNNTSYIKFGKVAICWGTKTWEITNQQPYGEANSGDIAFPVTYKTAPSVVASPNDMNGACGEYASTSGVSTTKFNIWGGHSAYTAQTSFTARWIAIGEIN